MPETLTDVYFRRDKKALRKQRQKQEGEIYATVKGGYTLSDTRKKDQVNSGDNSEQNKISLSLQI